MARQEPDLEVGVGASCLSEFVARREVNMFLDDECEFITDLKQWTDKSIIELIRKFRGNLKDLTDEELSICVTFWKNK